MAETLGRGGSLPSSSFNCARTFLRFASHARRDDGTLNSGTGPAFSSQRAPVVSSFVDWIWAWPVKFIKQTAAKRVRHRATRKHLPPLNLIDAIEPSSDDCDELGKRK